MSALTDKKTALQSDASISSRIRTWIYEATNRIEANTAEDEAEAAARVALAGRVSALEATAAHLAADLAAANAATVQLAARVSALEPIAAEPPPDPPAPLVAPVGPFTLMDGGGTEPSGVFDYNPSGSVYEKLHVQNYTGWGIGAMRNPAADIAVPVVVRDCIIENVAAVPPGSDDGRSEACLWIGNRAAVDRVQIRNGAWMGMWTGAACFDSVFQDIEVSDCPGTGLYIEHETKRAVFRRCKFSAVGNAVNIEWWYGGKGSNSIVFEDCEFHSETGWGIFADAGTYDVTVRRCKFTGNNGIALPQNLADPSMPNVLDVASCDFSGVAGIAHDTHGNAIG